MSWKVSKLVVEARLAGLYKDLPPTEFFVLVLLADACRNDSVVASISMSELETLTGLSRTTMSRAIRGLIAKECIQRTEYGSQGQASKYAMLSPESRSADATYLRGADATCDEPDHVAYHVANASDHVANAFDHVAPTQQPRSAHATNPDTDLTIPTDNPETATRVRARERGTEIVNDFIPGLDRRGGAKRMLVEAVTDGLYGLGEDRVLDLLAQWLELPRPDAYRLRGLIDAALKDEP
jgi:DNA-binding MarR family transcriptional regulator